MRINIETSFLCLKRMFKFVLIPWVTVGLFFKKNETLKHLYLE